MSKTIKTKVETSMAKKQLPLSKLKRTINTDPNPCLNCYNDNFTSEPYDYLDLEAVVVKMITNYQANQYQRIVDPSTTVAPIPDDARSVYFSLNKLKSFIFEIERLCCERNCNEVLGELGIRFYYGAYNKTSDPLTGVRSDYYGKHTLVLVPTYTQIEPDGSPIHIDFSPDRFNMNSDGNPSCTPESLDQNSTYGDSTMEDSSTSLPKLLSKKKKPQKVKQNKIMVLVGGINDKPKKQTKLATTKTKSVLSPSEIIMNHGDLIPPPSKTPIVRYKDATLLNC